jgi:hypothetical protein
LLLPVGAFWNEEGHDSTRVGSVRERSKETDR